MQIAFSLCAVPLAPPKVFPPWVVDVKALGVQATPRASEMRLREVDASDKHGRLEMLAATLVVLPPTRIDARTQAICALPQPRRHPKAAAPCSVDSSPRTALRNSRQPRRPSAVRSPKIERQSTSQGNRFEAPRPQRHAAPQRRPSQPLAIKKNSRPAPPSSARQRERPRWAPRAAAEAHARVSAAASPTRRAGGGHSPPTAGPFAPPPAATSPAPLVSGAAIAGRGVCQLLPRTAGPSPQICCCSRAPKQPARECALPAGVAGARPAAAPADTHATTPTEAAPCRALASPPTTARRQLAALRFSARNSSAGAPASS